MAKKKRRDRVPTPSWEQPDHSGIAGTLTGRSPTFYLTGAVLALVAIALGVVAYALIKDYVDDQRRPGSLAVRVEDEEFDLRYYTERLTTYVQQNGGIQSPSAQPDVAVAAVTSDIVKERVLLRFAGELGISATEDDVNEEIASRLQTEVGSPDFETRLQDELDRTGISEDLFRDQIRASVLETKLNDHFMAELPETADSVHYRQILVATREDAEEIEAEIEGGADGAEIAMERSLDTETSADGGDVGWVPRDVLAADVEDTIFSMEPGDVRIQEIAGSFFVFQMIEKDPAHEIEEDQQPLLAARRSDEWIQDKVDSITVEDFVSNDEDKLSWAFERAYGL